MNTEQSEWSADEALVLDIVRSERFGILPENLRSRNAFVEPPTDSRAAESALLAKLQDGIEREMKRALALVQEREICDLASFKERIASGEVETPILIGLPLEIFSRKADGLEWLADESAAKGIALQAMPLETSLLVIGFDRARCVSSLLFLDDNGFRNVRFHCMPKASCSTSTDGDENDRT